MGNLIRPILELSVVIPGMLLAYLPVRSYLKWSSKRLAMVFSISLVGICIGMGSVCYVFHCSTKISLLFLLALVLIIYQKTLQISAWKSVSIFLAICAVFSCENSLARAVNAIMTADLEIVENEAWLCIGAGIFYNALCWLFVGIAWYPASHAAQTMVEDENFAETWYIFWVLPLIFIGLNQFMIPKYRITLYTGRVLQGYIVISLVLLGILIAFYAMFLQMAQSLNRNARLQAENHFLTLQRERYDNLCAAIEEARQARHDMRHHFLQLSAMAQKEDLEGIKIYLSKAVSKIPETTIHYCKNQAVDSVIGYYAAQAEKEAIPFSVQVDLQEQIGINEVDLCLILSNLLENAIEASLRIEKAKRGIDILLYQRGERLLLLQVENAFTGRLQKKNGIFQSSKRDGNGIGIESVRHICEKNGGDCSFVCENDKFTAKIMLRALGSPK